MFSIYNNIFVIDTEKDGTQNFLPLYKGQSPSFIKTDPNFIYVLDGQALMQVVI